MKKIKKINVKIKKPSSGIKKDNMVLNDENLELEWFKVTKDNIDDFETEFDEIGSWSENKNIQRFIASRERLDDLFRSFVNDENNANDNISTFCLCKVGDVLAGFVYVSSPIGNNDFSSIDYIVVNPKLHGRGAGTRMISSIKNNLEFFNYGAKPNTIVASVEEENVFSNKMFRNHDFRPVSSNYSSTGRKYIAYYFTPRQLEMDR